MPQAFLESLLLVVKHRWSLYWHGRNNIS